MKDQRQQSKLPSSCDCLYMPKRVLNAKATVKLKNFKQMPASPLRISASEHEVEVKRVATSPKATPQGCVV